MWLLSFVTKIRELSRKMATELFFNFEPCRPSPIGSQRNFLNLIIIFQIQQACSPVTCYLHVHFFHFFMEFRKYSGYVFQGFLYFACSMSLVKCIFLVSFHREWHLNLSPLSQETCYLLTGSLLAVCPQKPCQINRLKQKSCSSFCKTLTVRMSLLCGSTLIG